jgi:hypothetical protein
MNLAHHNKSTPTLPADGNFALATSFDLDKRCAGGTERGEWDVLPGTSQLRFHIKTGTSGPGGFSDLDTPVTVRFTEAGMLLITNAASADEVTLVRR